MPPKPKKLSILKMTGPETKDLLNLWVHHLTKYPQYRAKYLFDDNKPSTTATTKFRQPIPLVHIGTHDLATKAGILPDDLVISKAVTLFHEAHHVFQDYNLVHLIQPISTPLLISEIAYTNNPGLYLRDYPSNLCEMDAEAHGMLMAAQAIKQTLPRVTDKQCQHLITEYMADLHQNQIKAHPYFTAPLLTTEEYRQKYATFATVEDILSAFKDAGEYYNTHAKIPSPKNAKERIDSDEFYLTTQVPIYVAPMWRPIAKQIRQAPTGWEKDLMLACLTLYIHPEYRQQSQALNGLTLSPIVIFGRDLPESPDQIRKRIEPYAPNRFKGRIYRETTIPRQQQTPIPTYGEQLARQQRRAKNLVQPNEPSTELDDPTNPYNN